MAGLKETCALQEVIPSLLQFKRLSYCENRFLIITNCMYLLKKYKKLIYYGIY